MEFIPCLIPPLFLLFGAAILYLRYRMRRSRPADYEAIDSFLVARGLTRIDVVRDDNYWRYWIRGMLSLSNCARIYVVKVEERGGAQHELHVAFDVWPFGGGKLHVLMQRQCRTSR